MIPVTALGQQEAEQRRVAGIDATKGKKKDRREAASMADDMAGEAARGALYGADGDPGEDASKAYADLGVHEGPASLMAPGPIAAGEFARSYDSAGHAAQSPQHAPPNPMPAQAPGTPYPRHVDLRDNTALAVDIRPDGAPATQGEHPR